MNYVSIILIFFIGFSLNLKSQAYFEGMLEYKISYDLINKNIPLNYLKTEFGSAFKAYVKEDKYMTIFNSKGKFGWKKTIVLLDEGYSYTEYEKVDTIFKVSLIKNNFELMNLSQNSQMRKKVLDEWCDAIILDVKSNDSKSPFKEINSVFYYNTKYRLNPKKYKHYNSRFWNKFVALSNSISIRNESHYVGFFKTISEAVLINQEKLSNELFLINPNKVVKIEEN